MLLRLNNIMELCKQIYSKDNFNKAWVIIKAKKSTGGIDNLSITEFENNYANYIKDLQNELFNNSYVPEPYKRIFIEKNKTEYRPLSLLTIKDKLVQMCFIEHYREKVEKKFEDTSYAYRINKGHTKAIKRIKDFISRGNNWFCAIDIDNFFDRINRELLIKKCCNYINDTYSLKLIEMWIRIGVIEKGKYVDYDKGIAQGGVISPLLSNIYLDCYDKAMKDKNFANVRYADNILLIEKNEEQLIKSLEFTQKYLIDELSLKLNKIENKAIDLNINPFTFCGIQFTKTERKIDPIKKEKIHQKISDLINKKNINEFMPDINEHLKGLKLYYSSFETEDQINEIEDHLIKELTIKVEKIKEQKINFKINELKTILYQIQFVSLSKIKTKKNIINNIIYGKKKETQSNTLEVKKALHKKRAKYQKFWYENLDILISGAFSQIGKSANSITIRKDGKIKNEISAEKIKNIVISAKGVTISSDAVKLCAQKNIRINYFDELGKPYASIISSAIPFPALILKQTESLNNQKAKLIAKNIIYAKIKNQVGLIKFFWKNKINNPEAKVISTKLDLMNEITEKVKTIDLKNDIKDLRASLMGYEGSAAATYWELFAKTIPDIYYFEKREHQNAQNVVNMMLNYSYGILYTRILSAVTLVGLNPNISFVHTESKNKPTLVFDIIELFRAPVADRTVIAILQKGIKVEADKKLLSDNTKNILAKKTLTRLNSEFKYRNKITSYNDIIVEQVKDIAAFIKDDKKLYKPFLIKW